MASTFKERFGNLGSAVKGMFVDDSQTIIAQDKLVVANAGGKQPVDSRPTKVTTKARHAGMIYNPSEASRISEVVYTKQEYDMAVIANAIDTESMFRRSIEKYVELIWKSGFKWIGKNTKAVNYLKKRLEQIAMVTSVPNEELLRQISYQLVGYSNVYVSKVRNINASGGKYRKTFTGKILIPVAGYFVEDTVSMRLAAKKNGDMIGYKQHIDGTQTAKVWKPSSMIHMFASRKPGLRVGTPMVWPVLDDIRALRKIEQNVELLIFQHTIPLYHYKVGSDDRPAQDIEITAVKSTVEKMPPNGAIVTPERHDITAIGAEKTALDVSLYLKYFKDRVLGGLGMSSIAMGEGGTSNKSTAGVLDKHMENTTETFQRIIAMFINEFMVKELLAEGGYVYDAMDEDNKVELYFPPIDKEEQRSKENHVAMMYSSHQISEDEMRLEIGRDPISDDVRKNMYFEIIETARADQQAEIAEDAAKFAAKNSNVVANKAKPTNQSGSKVKPKIAKNDELYEAILDIYDSTKEDTMEAYDDYSDGDELSFRVINNVKKTVFDLSKNMIVDKVQTCDTMKDKDFFNYGIDKLFNDLLIRIEPVFGMKNKYDAVTKISSIFETSRHRLDAMYSTNSITIEDEINE